MSAMVRIWSFDQFEAGKSLYSPAMETRFPLLAASSKVKNGMLPVIQVGISMSRSGVAVTAFGPNPDGEGTLLRLWEQQGTSGNLDVSLPAGANFGNAHPVNLRGENNGAAVKITGGRFSFDLHSYAPVSFILK
jgi:hypothetical protein